MSRNSCKSKAEIEQEIRDVEEEIGSIKGTIEEAEDELFDAENDLEKLQKALIKKAQDKCERCGVEQVTTTDREGDTHLCCFNCGFCQKEAAGSECEFITRSGVGSWGREMVTN